MWPFRTTTDTLVSLAWLNSVFASFPLAELDPLSCVLDKKELPLVHMCDQGHVSQLKYTDAFIVDQEF